MALARLYEAHHQPAKAVAITEELLKRNPSSLNVRVATIGAALAAGNTSRAAELAAQTKEEFSDEPQAWVASANVARAQGHSGEALSELRMARTLRSKQLDTTSSSDASDVMPEGWLIGRQYALNLPDNVASDVSPMPISAIGPSEPVTREYERYAQYLPPTPLDDVRPARSVGSASLDSPPAGWVADPSRPSLAQQAPLQLTQDQSLDQVSPATSTRSGPRPRRRWMSRTRPRAGSWGCAAPRRRGSRSTR